MGGNPSPAPPPVPPPTPPPTVGTGEPSSPPTTPYPSENPTPAPTCGVAEHGNPQLGVTIADQENAGSGEDVYASILVGKKAKKAEWTDWQQLAHPGCDNLARGTTGWFDQFVDEDQTWYGVAFHNCGTDDALLEEISFWNGDGQSSIDLFCETVSGGYGEICVEQADTDSGDCFKGYDSPIYERVWLKAKNDDCNSMFINLDAKSSTGVAVGAPYYQNSPGLPDCGLTVRAQRAHNSNSQAHGYQNGGHVMSAARIGPAGVVQESFIQSDILAIVVAILLTFCVVYTYFKRRYSDSMYKQIPQSLEEAEVSNY